MASNQTPNLQLCQWEADDKVLRADFNADNAKLDAAVEELRQVDARKADVSALDLLSQKVAALSAPTLLLDTTLETQTTLWRISLRGLDFSPFRELVLYPEVLSGNDTVFMYFNNSRREEAIVFGGSIPFMGSYNAFFHTHDHTLDTMRQANRARFDLAFPRIVCEFFYTSYTSPTSGRYGGNLMVSMDTSLTWSNVTEIDFGGPTLAPGSRIKLYGVR